MRTRMTSFAALCFLSHHVFGCREPGRAWTLPRDDASDGGSAPSAGDVPDARLPRQEPTSSTDREPRPDDAARADYATDVYLNAGCDLNPPTAAVAANHATESLCEHVIGIAARNDDGDFYEIGVPFEWTVEHPALLGLVCQNGPSDNFCRPFGAHDLFDGDGEAEPSTAVWGCAVNDCPDPRPADCADLVCRSVTIVTVVNLEGAWSFTDPMTEAPVLLTIAQDGRTFEDQDGLIEHGTVFGATVGFESGDYLYEGILSSDRSAMSGTVTDLLTLSTAGVWSAVRAGP